MRELKQLHRNQTIITGSSGDCLPEQEMPFDFGAITGSNGINNHNGDETDGTAASQTATTDDADRNRSTTQTPPSTPLFWQFLQSPFFTAPTSLTMAMQMQTSTARAAAAAAAALPGSGSARLMRAKRPTSLAIAGRALALRTKAACHCCYCGGYI